MSRVSVLQLDHLVIVAPTLEVGGDYIEQTLGIRPWYGGKHRELGTHNLLLRIGDDVFLEVIALDPESTHQGPRVFGIESIQRVEADWYAGRRLRTWVCRTEHLEPVVAKHSYLVGQIKAVTRGERHWQMAIPVDGSLPLAGLLPTPVQYEPQMIPARRMPENGLRFKQLIVRHLEPENLSEAYRSMNVQGDVVVEKGDMIRIKALIEGDTIGQKWIE